MLIKPAGLEKGVPRRACTARSPFHAIAARFTCPHTFCRGAGADRGGFIPAAEGAR